MATPIEKCVFRECVIQELLSTIRSYCEEKNIRYKTLNACRQLRRFKNGDFIVPKGCMDELSSEDVSSLQNEIVEKTRNSVLPIKQVTRNELHTLILFVNRPKAYHNVISQVILEGGHYGKTDKKEKKLVFLNSVDLATACEDSVPGTDKNRIVIPKQINPHTLSSTSDCQSQVPSSTNDCHSQVSSSTSDYHSQVSSSTSDCHSQVSSSTNDCHSQVPSSTNDCHSQVPSSTNDCHSQVPSSTNDCHSQVPSSTNDCHSQVPSSTSDCHSQVPSSTNLLLTADIVNQTPLIPVCLRAIVMFKHITQLLHATGHQVVEVPCPSSAAVLELCCLLGYQLRQTSVDRETLCCFTHQAEVSPFRSPVCQSGKASLSDAQQQECNAESTRTSNYSDDIVIDLSKFISELELVQSKMAYDKHLHLVDVKRVDGPTNILHRVARLHNCHVLDGQQLSADVTCVHLVPHNGVFTQLQTDLLWKILTPAQTLLKQSHLIVGSVMSRQEGIGQCQISAEEFIRLRYKQVKQLSDLKYGEELGCGLESALKNLTAAVIKFEMLNTACKNILKLDVSYHADGGPGAETKAGLFVIYNCARMATLFRHFQDDVQKGIYPELPSLDRVNFGLLREEEEWCLLFNYISVYPDVVQNSVEDIGPEKSDVYAKIHTHKIVNFLIGLSRNLSSYYRRIHILCEGKPHLLPVMYARLYLMKAVHQILINGLRLLDIEPFNEI